MLSAAKAAEYEAKVVSEANIKADEIKAEAEKAAAEKCEEAARFAEGGRKAAIEKCANIIFE